jgi:hypothetical protein
LTAALKGPPRHACSLGRNENRSGSHGAVGPLLIAGHSPRRFKRNGNGTHSIGFLVDPYLLKISNLRSGSRTGKTYGRDSGFGHLDCTPRLNSHQNLDRCQVGTKGQFEKRHTRGTAATSLPIIPILSLTVFFEVTVEIKACVSLSDVQHKFTDK